MLVWFGCRCEVGGKITRVDKDANGADVIDLEVPDINEFFHCENDSADWYKFQHALTRVIPCGPVTIVDLQYQIDNQLADDYIIINTPEGGCGACCHYCKLLPIGSEQPEWP